MDSVIANRHRTSLCAEVSALAEPTEGATAVDVAACDESVHSAGYHELDDARALVDLDLGLDIIARTLRKRADLLDAVACVEDVPAVMSIVLPDLAGLLRRLEVFSPDGEASIGDGERHASPIRRDGDDMSASVEDNRDVACCVDGGSVAQLTAAVDDERLSQDLELDLGHDASSSVVGGGAATPVPGDATVEETTDSNSGACFLGDRCCGGGCRSGAGAVPSPVPDPEPIDSINELRQCMYEMRRKAALLHADIDKHIAECRSHSTGY